MSSEHLSRIPEEHEELKSSEVIDSNKENLNTEHPETNNQEDLEKWSAGRLEQSQKRITEFNTQISDTEIKLKAVNEILQLRNEAKKKEEILADTIKKRFNILDNHSYNKSFINAFKDEKQIYDKNLEIKNETDNLLSLEETLLDEISDLQKNAEDIQLEKLGYRPATGYTQDEYRTKLSSLKDDLKIEEDLFKFNTDEFNNKYGK